MKLRSLVLRTILAWVPILPPPPLLARPQREAALQYSYVVQNSWSILLTPGPNPKKAYIATVHLDPR